MYKKLIALAVFATAALLVACGGGGGGASPPSGGGGGGGGGGNVGTDTIGMSLPNTTIGVENDPTWGSVGGYTQSARSQVIAFAPGTTITIKNLSSSIKHTLNVISTSGGPPANFPTNPSLSLAASGGSNFGSGYASGSINPGGSVTVTLATAGTYLVGCAYDYAGYAMRDVIEVSSSATPGPQATAPPAGGGGGY
jgi:plastocyanin